VSRPFAILALTCIVSVAPAQDAPKHTLHDAWLAEVMDLDFASAVEGYRRIASDRRSPSVERWIASARLMELHRCGLEDTEPPANADVPSVLLERFEALGEPVSVEATLTRLRGAPADVFRDVGTTRVPAMRPFVPETEDWLLRQIGSDLRSRIPPRVESSATREGLDGPRRYSDRLFALDILRAELQGRTTRASALRNLYFADWQPPIATGDPGDVMARVRSRLADWRREDNLTSAMARGLEQLAQALDERAEDPAAAIALVRRLPLYSDRLLAERAPAANGGR
jgi:hypothetical protein